MPETHEVTLLLAQWAKSSQKGLDKLRPYSYRELRELAASYLRGRALIRAAVGTSSRWTWASRRWTGKALLVWAFPRSPATLPLPLGIEI
jgi:hypothetical protein